MEVTALDPDLGGHAASLLTRLNLQRKQAQFCDCVVRQKQSPAQLYPAHRCVLAASSPVLDSVLSSAGALVELQAPCLSGSVLALLLDYIYTGALPCACTQQQYYSLLAAAHYLQMDRLQEDLCAWEKTEASVVDNLPCERRSYSKTADASTKPKETVTCGAGSLEKRIETTADAQPLSASRGPRIKEAEPDACEASRTNGATQCSSRKPASPATMSESSRSAHNGRAASHLTLQNQTRNIPSTAEGYSASQLHKDTQKDQFHPAGTIKPQTWQNNTHEEMERTDEGTRSSSSLSSSPSSSPQPCCGAVPVICHSSRASAVTPLNSSRAAASQPASAGHQSVAQSLTAEHKRRHESDEPGHKRSRDQTGTEDGASQRLCHTCIKAQSDTLTEKPTSSNAGHFPKLDEEHVKSKRLHQQADWCDRCDASISAVARKCSDDVPLPVLPDLGSSPYYCPKAEAKEEHVFGRGDLSEPGTAPYARLQRQVLSVRHESDSHEEDAATLDKRHDARVCLPLPDAPESGLDHATGFECSTSLDLGKISDTETSEPLFGFAVPDDSGMSNPACGATGQSYHGHVRYHCIPQDHLSHGDARYERSHPRRRDRSNRSSEEEEPCVSPLGPHCSAGASEQFLLLDISTKHAELLVSYKDGADQEHNSSASGTEGKNIGREQRNDAAETRKVRARTDVEAECFHKVRHKCKPRETRVEEQHFVAGEQSRPSAAATGEAPKHEDGENQTSALRFCSAPRVPESARASVSSTLSVCIPAALPAAVSADAWARQPAPAHHAFHCSLCDRSFSQRGSLNRHVRSHLGVRPFPCPRCPMTFSRQYRVTEHMRVHQRCSLGSDFPRPPMSSI